ncbi:MAG: selenide, water dikinase SelD, partial [Terriglobales bacterium]
VKAAGCAAKMSASELKLILAGLERIESENLLTGIENFEDAAVYKLTQDVAIVQTIDFFPPVVDDPFLYGRIAATNALSDIYAMGAVPVLALNVLCFPTCDYPVEVVQQIVRGGAQQVAQAGALLAGGHSIQSAEPVYGLSVMGTVHPSRILTNSGARDGDRLVLCKAIGTGVGLLGLKAGLLSESAEHALVDSMTTLGKAALDTALKFPVHSATDVTGFGLIGHVHEMAKGSALAARINADAVRFLPETPALAEQGFVPAGAYGNRKSYEPFLTYINDVDLSIMDLLFDPQTSGGLMFALEERHVESLLQELTNIGAPASCIGEFRRGKEGVVEVAYAKNS